MHGTLTSAVDVERLRNVARARLHAYRWFIGIVLLPTLLTALYFGLFAANQYESETHFIVRSTSQGGGLPTGLGQMISLVGGTSNAQSEALSVGDYLLSHDAMQVVQKGVDLPTVFRRPEADLISRLWQSDPTPETLLKYYRGKVDVRFDSENGISTLKVRSFRPTDSYAIASLLLGVGERHVNEVNRRVYDSSVAMARRQLAEAEQAATATQRSMTAFRQSGRDVDPGRSAAAQLEVVSQLRGQLAMARAAQASAAGSLASGSPQARLLAARVASIQAQVAAENGRLAGGGGTIAAGLGRYEEMRMRQDFAAKRYAAAAASLEAAREQAMKQQLFVIRLVKPNMPVKALYPRAFTIVMTVFAGLLLAYGIGWLLVAGFREHAA